MLPRLKAWALGKTKAAAWSTAKHGAILYAGLTTLFWAMHNQNGVEMTWLETAGWFGRELWSAIA